MTYFEAWIGTREGETCVWFCLPTNLDLFLLNFTDCICKLPNAYKARLSCFIIHALHDHPFKLNHM